jgi:hypothetical protein
VLDERDQVGDILEGNLLTVTNMLDPATPMARPWAGAGLPPDSDDERAVPPRYLLA